MKLQAAKQTQQAVSYLQMQQQQLQAIQQQVQVYVDLHFPLNECCILCVIFYTHSMPLSVSLSVYIFPSLILSPSFPFRHSLTRTHTHMHTHTFTLYSFSVSPSLSLPHSCPLLSTTHHQGASSPWNIGAAYRVPDSNINLSCTYQQGRASIQVRKILWCTVHSNKFLIYHV